MSMLAKLRRVPLQEGLPIREISGRTGLSKNTVEPARRGATRSRSGRETTFRGRDKAGSSGRDRLLH